MKQLFVSFLLVCSVLWTKLIDVLSAIFGKRLDAADAVDAWFRNSNSRLPR